MASALIQRLPYPAQLLVFILFSSVAVLGFIVVMALFMIWFERKIIGHLQSRIGPLHVGKYFGWAQPIADTLKLFLKEDIVPRNADKVIFTIAPVVAFVSSFMAYVTIPFAKNLVAKDINMGILYIFAVSSFATIGIFMGGWASNNKYSLLGAMRVAAQIVSYEVPLLLSVLGVAMLAETLSLTRIVEAQRNTWYVFYQPVGFFIYFTAGVAEVNRLPFDIPEAEAELVAGFHTEYSGLKWAFFFLSEYANMFIISAVATVLFLGGWLGPFLPGLIWFLLKAFFLMFIMVWVRGTYPRLRVDQMMGFCWKFLLPLAFLNIILTGLIMVLAG
ncbi:MAG: NADH-quinone oxidoreductase subunit NuoH [Candidatus Eisenbacteria bacterium]|nr:NADH-quinone oxidoreductase subunit NuoH [Candidatus Eisenbacteria bacterium]